MKIRRGGDGSRSSQRRRDAIASELRSMINGYRIDSHRAFPFIRRRHPQQLALRVSAGATEMRRRAVAVTTSLVTMRDSSWFGARSFVTNSVMASKAVAV